MYGMYSSGEFNQDKGTLPIRNYQHGRQDVTGHNSRDGSRTKAETFTRPYQQTNQDQLRQKMYQ